MSTVWPYFPKDLPFLVLRILLRTVSNDVQHPNWVEPNGNFQLASYMSHASPNCSVFLTGGTTGAVTVEVLIRV
ncbi:MAG TPA: hypothetical protein VIW07_16295 [Candidatus Udaeobacter sp.]